MKQHTLTYKYEKNCPETSEDATAEVQVLHPTIQKIRSVVGNVLHPKQRAPKRPQLGTRPTEGNVTANQQLQQTITRKRDVGHIG